jgi:hypothetical protein
MEQSVRRPFTKGWIAFSGLLAFGFTLLILRELPSMRRELRLMRM